MHLPLARTDEWAERLNCRMWRIHDITIWSRVLALPELELLSTALFYNSNGAFTCNNVHAELAATVDTGSVLRPTSCSTD